MGLKLKRFAPLWITPVAVTALLTVGESQLRAQSPAKSQGKSARQPELR